MKPILQQAVRLNASSATIRIATVLAGFGTNQIIRLGMSIIMTRLLAPDLMGVMVIINTLRTGIELLTDVGLGANIVRHPQGRTPEFLRTAWTVQAARGLMLTLIFLALSPLVARLYHRPELAGLLAASSLLFTITGIKWPALMVLQKDQRVLERVRFDVFTNLLFTIISIALAWWLRSTWSLVFGLLAGETMITVLSFFVPIGISPRLAFNRAYFREMIHFGKWIFVGSALYFAAISFDKLYLSATMTLFALGIYNVGRTLSDAIGQAILQLGEFIVFPTIAAFRGEKDELTRKLRAARRRMLVPAALGLATVAAFSPLLVFTLYDSRYHSAALVAPALMVAVWPTLLSIIAEMVMRGIGKSAPGASGNAAKLATLVLAMPIGFLKGGMLGALLAMNLAEWLRYAAIASAARRSGISFLRDDTRLTLLFASVAGGLIMLVAHGWLGIGMADIRQWAGSFTR